MYVAGGPIEDERDFYGRNELVSRLLQGRDRAIFLMGLRRTGKTSILRACERACADFGMMPMFLQLQSAEGLRDVVADAVDALHWEGGEDLDDDVLDAAPLSRLFKLADRLAARQKRTLLVLVDESELLVELRAQSPADVARLRRWLLGRPSKRVILTGSRYALRLAELGGGSNPDPFLAGFARVPLPAVLDTDSARALVALGQREGQESISLDQAGVDLLVERTGGHPFLLQSACMEVRRGADVEGALSRVLESHAANWAFFEDLQRTSPREREALALALAGEPVPAGLQPFARSLVEAGLLTEVDDRWAVRVALLRDYLAGRGWLGREWPDCPSTMTDDQAVPGAGRRDSSEARLATGRIILLDHLGGGGFGDVYRARVVGDAGFERIVAVKILHERWKDQKDLVARMRDEARILGLLRHPSIVRGELLCELKGRTAVVMEYVEGEDLSGLLGRGLRPPPRAAEELIATVADALSAAQDFLAEEGRKVRVLHRDIKPGNLRVTPFGTVKVLDFGIAFAEFEGREAITRFNAPGTPDYLAPERRLGSHDHPGSDVFSLGLVLLEMLVGRPGPLAVNRSEHVEWVHAAVARLPDFHGDLIRQMLAWEPERRPSADRVAKLCWAAQSEGEGLRAWATATLGSALPQESPDEESGTWVDPEGLQ